MNRIVRILSSAESAGREEEGTQRRGGAEGVARASRPWRIMGKMPMPLR